MIKLARYFTKSNSFCLYFRIRSVQWTGLGGLFDLHDLYRFERNVGSVAVMVCRDQRMPRSTPATTRLAVTRACGGRTKAGSRCYNRVRPSGRFDWRCSRSRSSAASCANFIDSSSSHRPIWQQPGETVHAWDSTDAFFESLESDIRCHRHRGRHVDLGVWGGALIIVQRRRAGRQLAKAGNEAGAGGTAGRAVRRNAGVKPADSSKMVSSIAGDRLSVIPNRVALSKQTESSPFRFAEIARESGIDFVHFSGMTDEKHFPTANGSGVAVFDYDNDGLLDIYFATATLLPLGTAVKGPNRLYKNLGGNHFKDVTEASGLGFRGFCHGIIAGDIDNDGDQDVFLCNYGSNALYLNNGDGTFKDISKEAGIDAPNWSSGGAMLDYDNDGYLDIYVTNYGRWNYPEDHRRVGDDREEDLALLVAANDQDGQAPFLP